MDKKKILAIDDEPDVLEFLELVLEKSGFQPITASNGTKGLMQAHVDPPDLILLDIMMNELDGWETLRQLKRDDSLRHIPVVILSARAEPQDMEQAIQLGAVDYIVKPFSIRESLARIRDILAQSEQAPSSPTV